MPPWQSALGGLRIRTRFACRPRLLSTRPLPAVCESLRPLLQRHGAAPHLVENSTKSVLGRLELSEALDQASVGEAASQCDLSAAVAEAAALRLKLSFLSTLNQAERAELCSDLPAAKALLALTDVVSRLEANGEDVSQTIEDYVSIPVSQIPNFDQEQFSRRISAAMPWAQRSEVLLTLGCDDRITIDPDQFAPRKVNKYFTSSVPDVTTVHRSSCTSSSTSTMSFAAADLHRERLLSAAITGTPADDQMDVTLEAMRERVLASFGLLDSGAQVVLTPSGTDAEMLPTIVALGRQRSLYPEHHASWKPENGPAVVTFISAALEVGSGTADASGLRHFAPLAPRGQNVQQTPGNPLDGVPDGLIQIIEQPPRDSDGEFCSSECDNKLQQAVRDSLNEFPEAVGLVHIVAGCKTGLCTPSVPAVERLRNEFGPRLVIVVDACQVRSDLSAVGRWCNELDAVTLITTSKFLQGAPFFGGALFSAPLAEELEAAAAAGCIPAGCSNYFTKYDVPKSMPNTRARLPDWHNHGLLLRGESGLAHLESYASIPKEQVAKLAQVWANGVRKLVEAQSPYLTLLHETGSPPDRLGGTNTIISIVMHPSGDHSVDALDVPTLRKAYGMLAQDLSEKLCAVATTEELELVRFKASLGQPVKLGNLPHGVLRIALGANMVIKWMDEATDDGVEVGRRVRESLKEDACIVAKMQVMAKYWPYLEDDYQADPEQQLAQPKSIRKIVSTIASEKEQLHKALRTNGQEVSNETSSKLSSVLRTMLNDNILQQEDTPLAVVYDLDHLRAGFERCTKAFPAAFTHCFAMKAAPMSFLAKEAIHANFGIECASRLEVINALRNGCSPEKVVFDAPAKTHSEIRYALEQGVSLNCNTLDELERVASIYEAMGGETSSRIGVRVNPLLGAGKIQALSVSTASSKFGVSNLDSVLDAFRAHSWLSMLHVHVGSQGCSLEMLAEGVGVIANLADEINAAAGKEQVKVLDIGGGLPVDYESCDDSPSFEDYATALKAHAPQLFDPNRPPGSVLTEFGRALSAKSASIVSAVEYTMHREAETQLAVIHAGSDLFLRACYAPNNFSHRVSAYDQNGAALSSDIFSSKCNRMVKSHDIVGPMCFAGDVVARQVQVPQLDVGDWVVVHDCGANTLGMFSRHCSRPAPPVYGYTNSAEDSPNVALLKEQETDESVLTFWD